MRLARLASSLACLGLVSGVYINDSARADQTNLLVCIKQYTALGISPDAALGECKKTSMGECVQKFLGLKYEPVAIKYVDPKTPGVKEAEAGYLIDLGDNKSRWLEGKQWQSKECLAYIQGPYKKESDDGLLKLSAELSGNLLHREWFRQGFCKSDKIQLDHPYSIEEAKLRCEAGVLLAPVLGAPKSDDVNKRS